MSDLVKRLRRDRPPALFETANEAADEIKRLRAALQEIAANQDNALGRAHLIQLARHALEEKS